MTKNELREYRSIVREIEEAEVSVTEKTKHSKVTGSDTEFPYNKRGIAVSGLKHGDDSSNTLSHLNRLRRQRDKVDTFIENIPDRITQKIFLFKYINGDRKISWNDVAEIVGGGNTADSVRKMAMRYLSKHTKK